MNVNVGVIGYSEGNGHPYSWSAIANGYDPVQMLRSGYSVISEYLGQQDWPGARLPGVSVTTVWCPDRERARSIACAALIPKVAGTLDELIAEVDAVLLARDDAENHMTFARPVLEAGLPIYIDKPIAHSIRELERLYDLERYPGQIFTCSALRYAEELRLSEEDADEIGRIVEIHATTPKSWRKYSAHIIEPVLNILGQSACPEASSSCNVAGRPGASGVSVRWSSGTVTRLYSLGDVQASIRLLLFGIRGERELKFHDSFSAFKSALHDFLEGVRCKDVRSPKDANRKVVELIEAGCR